MFITKKDVAAMLKRGGNDPLTEALLRKVMTLYRLEGENHAKVNEFRQQLKALSKAVEDCLARVDADIIAADEESTRYNEECIREADGQGGSVTIEIGGAE